MNFITSMVGSRVQLKNCHLGQNTILCYSSTTYHQFGKVNNASTLGMLMLPVLNISGLFLMSVLLFLECVGLLTAVHKDYFRVINHRDLLLNDIGDRVAQLLHVELVNP